MALQTVPGYDAARDRFVKAKFDRFSLPPNATEEQRDAAQRELDEATKVWKPLAQDRLKQLAPSAVQPESPASEWFKRYDLLRRVAGSATVLQSYYQTHCPDVTEVEPEKATAIINARTVAKTRRQALINALVKSIGDIPEEPLNEWISGEKAYDDAVTAICDDPPSRYVVFMRSYRQVYQFPLGEPLSAYLKETFADILVVPSDGASPDQSVTLRPFGEQKDDYGDAEFYREYTSILTAVANATDAKFGMLLQELNELTLLIIKNESERNALERLPNAALEQAAKDLSQRVTGLINSLGTLAIHQRNTKVALWKFLARLPATLYNEQPYYVLSVSAFTSMFMLAYARRMNTEALVASAIVMSTAIVPRMMASTNIESPLRSTVVIASILTLAAFNVPSAGVEQMQAFSRIIFDDYVTESLPKALITILSAPLITTEIGISTGLTLFDTAVIRSFGQDTRRVKMDSSVASLTKDEKLFAENVRRKYESALNNDPTRPSLQAIVQIVCQEDTSYCIPLEVDVGDALSGQVSYQNYTRSADQQQFYSITTDVLRKIVYGATTLDGVQNYPVVQNTIFKQLASQQSVADVYTSFETDPLVLMWHMTFLAAGVFLTRSNIPVVTAGRGIVYYFSVRALYLFLIVISTYARETKQTVSAAYDDFSVKNIFYRTIGWDK